MDVFEGGVEIWVPSGPLTAILGASALGALIAVVDPMVACFLAAGGI